MAEAQDRDRSERDDRSTDNPMIQMVSGVIGAVIVLATLAVILWDGFTNSGAPPDLQARALAVHQVTDGVLVEIRLRNDGDRAAESVTVVGAIDGAEGSETAEVVFDYVPAHSHRDGGLMFSPAAAGREPRLRARGYIAP